jgi:general secretion pathway protein K
VLIVVVWTIMLLSLLAAGLGARQVFALNLVQRMEANLSESYLAMAGVQRAITVLQRDLTPHADGFADAWSHDPASFADQVFGEGTYTVGYPVMQQGVSGVRYGVIDEERKLNLNTAPTDLLQRALEQVGQLREDEARTVAESVLDWRDEDHETRDHGAENFYYLGLDHGYECKDGPFENLEELLLVRGVTPALYQRLAPLLTVYGGGSVNINTALVEVLSALGLSEDGVNGVVFFRAGEDNVEGTMDDRFIASLAAIQPELSAYIGKEDANQLTQLLQEGVLTVGSQAFRVMVDARAAADGVPLHVECVVDRAGQVSLWKES